MNNFPCPDPQWLERCVQVWMYYQEGRASETTAKSLTEHILGNWMMVVVARRLGVTESNTRERQALKERRTSTWTQKIGASTELVMNR
jgi:hypothetical protein